MQGRLELDVVSVRRSQQEEQHVRALVLDRHATVGVVEQRHLLVWVEEAELLQQLGGSWSVWNTFQIKSLRDYNFDRVLGADLNP